MQWGVPLGVPMDNPWAVPTGVPTGVPWTMQWTMPTGVPWTMPTGMPWTMQWAVPTEIIQQVVREYEGTNPISLFDKYIIADHMNQIFNAMRKNDFCDVQKNLNKVAYDLTMLLPLEKNNIENYKQNLESYIYILLDVDIDTSAEKEDVEFYIKEIISFIDKILVGFAAVYEVRFQ